MTICGKARKNLAVAFEACGFPNARIDVWGQTQLIGLFHQYQSLCLRLRGHDHQGFRFWSSWAADADMQPPIHYSPEQFQLLEELPGICNPDDSRIYGCSGSLVWGRPGWR